ncbi:hypothetical protein LCGC14_1698100 [marine sediment metagenome]|uniref:Uncharacterized protein n=1 Tax=marine sediment metagenome TaxID=412755 RepID=A0A0F9KIS9_9ZZZZ
MGDVTSNVSVVQQGRLAGANFAVLTLASGSAADYFELETVINESDGGPGSDVKRVLYVTCTEAHTATAVTRPMIWTTTTDTITIGAGPSSAACEFFVLWK